jgi:hypothetical protein
MLLFYVQLIDDLSPLLLDGRATIGQKTKESQVIWILFALSVALAVTTLFLGREIMMKFRFMRNFLAMSHRNTVELYYSGDIEKPGMHKIRLMGRQGFSVLIGFELTVPLFGTGFDYFGFANSVPTHLAEKGQELVIELYLGRGPVHFKFFTNREAPDITAEIIHEDVEANVVYQPHWYQTLGFYG